MSKRIKKLIAKKDILIGRGLVRLSDPNQDKLEGSKTQQRNRINRSLKQYSEDYGVEFRLEKLYVVKKSGREESIHLREDLFHLWNDVDKGLLDFVIIEKLDRLSRFKEFNAQFIRLCDERGVIFMSIDEGGYVDMQDSGTRITIGIKNILAEEYSKDLSYKKKIKNREAMVNSGKDVNSTPCLGLDVSAPCFYKINKNELPQVERIFEKFISCKSLKITADWANSQGFKTKKRVQKEHKYTEDGEKLPLKTFGGECFNSTNLKKLLINPKLRGENSFHDEFEQFPKLQDDTGNVLWKYKHGRVISKEITDRVDNILASGSKKVRNRACSKGLLAGLFIHKDGSVFHSVVEGGKDYYRHPKHSIRIRRKELDKKIMQRLSEYVRNSEVLTGIVKSFYEKRLMAIPNIKAVFSVNSGLL